MSSNGQINIKFPDGNVKKFPKGISSFDVAKSISSAFAEEALVSSVNGRLVDLFSPIVEDAEIKFLKFSDEDGKKVYWHTSSHIMAQAIEELFPGAKFGVGPPIENGFYYDVDSDHKFSEEDLREIEKRMIEISRRDLKTHREEMKRLDAIKFFQSKRVDPYKVEILQDIAKDEEVVSLYHQGHFTDLCKGPHLSTTAKLKHVKLLGVSGSYWRGDSNKKQLQRIYGISFPDKKNLEEYLKILEEAKNRDHRKIGKESDLFSFHQESPGAPFWHNNGMIVLNLLRKYLREKLISLDYKEINTPILLNDTLWKQSGHYDNFKDNMYFTELEERSFALKPMNCPGSTLVYRTSLKSYRDLPLRLFEFGLVHRYELSGVLAGLFRVRSFTQDDAHIYCTNEQIEQEIISLINLVYDVYNNFGFKNIRVNLSTRPEKFMGDIKIWNQAEISLKNALEAANVEYKIKAGEGAFYGPKIDFFIKDSLMRNWQLGTIQLDFSMPERFQLEYVGSDGQINRPVMIHRAIIGSFERFLGVYIEHVGGNFPFWLAPVQLIVLPLTDNQKNFANSIFLKLKSEGFRTQIDGRNEKIGYKIREAEVKKIPYMIIMGDKEVQNNKVSMRAHKKGDIGSFTLEDFLEMLKKEYNPLNYFNN